MPKERAIWKGSISFGLVEIPVSLAVAERTSEISFHQLDRHDQSPIGYERVNKTTGKKVTWGDIVRGYEVAKGEFVIVTDDDIRRANVKATQTIDIQDFVVQTEIPPAFYERPYHLLPAGKNNKAYAVLRDVLAKKGLAAVALVVIRTRQHLCAIMSRGERLELELLRFGSELLPGAKGGVTTGKATAKEIALAEQLIESMVSEWDPGRYKDAYAEDLLAAIHEKAKNGAVEAHNVPEAAPSRGPIDLVELLQKSLKSGGPKGVSKRAPHPRRSTHGRAA